MLPPTPLTGGSSLRAGSGSRFSQSAGGPTSIPWGAGSSPPRIAMGALSRTLTLTLW